MMAPRILLLSTMLAATALAAPAFAYLAQNNFVVQPAEAGQFAVLPKGKLGVADAWCAAGDYVVRARAMPGTTRIWRLSAVPREKGAPMLFSLSSEGAFGNTGLVQLGGPGDGSMSAAAAQQLCWTLRRPKFTD